MKQTNLLKSMLLLFALIVGSTSVWAVSKPWSGDDPASTLDLKTVTSSTMGTWYGAKAWYLDDDYLIVTGYESYKSVANQTWITQAGVGNNGSTWEASDPFKGSSYYTNAFYATIQSGRYLLYKVTNMKSLKVYGKNSSTSKYLDIFIYTKSGDVYTKIEEIKYTEDKNEHIWENSETLDPAETYFVYITGVENSNSRVFEVAFERNSVKDTRKDSGLAYAVESQSISVGNVLSAPALTNPNDLTVTYSSEDEEIATVDASGNVTGVAKGSTTITASFAGDATYKSGSASYTINVTKVLASNSIMYESFDTNDQIGGNDGTWSNINTTPDPVFNLTGWTYDTAYGASQCVRIGKNGWFLSPAIGVAGDVTLTFRTESWGSDGSNGYIDIDGDGTFDDTETITGVTLGESNTRATVTLKKSGTWTEYTLKIIGVTADSKIKFSGPSGKRLFLDEVEVILTKQPVSITSAEYATSVSEYARDFSTTGITAYTATDEETKVTLNEITSGKVPANTPVVLYKAGADGTAINVPVIASADAVSDNDLKVSTGTDVANMYVLAKNPTIGFYPWTGSNLSAGKVYLQGKASYGAREFIGLGESGETTGVAELKDSSIEELKSAPMYNLAGQKVSESYKGIVIVNGKKYVRK